MEQLFCPNCGAEATSDDFACPKCEVILNAAALDEEPVSLVQALLSPANAPAEVPQAVAPVNVGNDVTVRATMIMDEFTVPRLVAGVDLALKPLLPFEAYVASFVDGTLSVPFIAEAAEVADVEVMAVLQALAFRGVVELTREEPGSAKARADSGEFDLPIDEDYPEEEKTDPEGFQLPDGVESPGGEGVAGDEAAAAEAPAMDAADEPAPVDDEDVVEEVVPAASAGREASGRPEAPDLAGVPLDSTAPTGEEDAVPADAAGPGGGGSAEEGAQGFAADAADVPAETAEPDAPSPADDAASELAALLATAPVPTAPPKPGPPVRAAAAPPPKPAVERVAPSAQPPPPVATAAAPAPRRHLPLERPTQLAPEPPKVDHVLQRAVNHERKGDIEGAIKVLKRAMDQVPKPAPLYNKLGLVLFKRGEFKEATQLLERATELEPENVVYQQNLMKIVAASAAKRSSGEKPQGGLLSKLLRGK